MSAGCLLDAYRYECGYVDVDVETWISLLSFSRAQMSAGYLLSCARAALPEVPALDRLVLEAAAVRGAGPCAARDLNGPG